MKLDFLRRLTRNLGRLRRNRLPPGQTLVKTWPVLTYGSTPRIDLDTWRFEIRGLVEEPVSFTWGELMALPQVTITSDIHCVTGWSRYDNEWRGVAVKELLRHVRLAPAARYVLIQ